MLILESKENTSGSGISSWGKFPGRPGAASQCGRKKVVGNYGKICIWPQWLPSLRQMKGTKGTLLLGATRIKQESITSCIADNVSSKKSDLYSKQELWRGSLQTSPTCPGLPKTDAACEKHHSEPLLFYPCQKGSVRRQPLCKAPPETTWQK